MRSRREFVRNLGLAAAGMTVGGTALARAGQAPARRPLMIGGRRVRTIDVHAHVFVPEVRAQIAAQSGGGQPGRYDHLLSPGA